MLVAQGLLEVLPGIGTRVAAARAAARGRSAGAATKDVEALVVEARRLRLDLGRPCVDAISTQWTALDNGGKTKG